jgi:hypothetical protein
MPEHISPMPSRTIITSLHSDTTEQTFDTDQVHDVSTEK